MMSDDLSRDVSRGMQDAVYRIRAYDMGLDGLDRLADSVGQYLDRKVWLAKETWYLSIYNMSVLSDPHLEGQYSWEPWRQKIQSFKKPLLDPEGKAREVAELINQEFRDAGYRVEDMLQTLVSRRGHYNEYIAGVAKEDESIAKFGHLVGRDFKNFNEMIAYMGSPNIFTKWTGDPNEISEFCSSIGYSGNPDLVVGVFTREIDCEACQTTGSLTHALLVREIDSLANTQLSWWKAQFEPDVDLILLGNGWGGHLLRRPVCEHTRFENISLRITKNLKALAVGYHFPFQTLDNFLAEVEDRFVGNFDFEDWSGEEIDSEEEPACNNGQLRIFTYQGPESLEKTVVVKFRIQEADEYDYWYTDWSYSIQGGCVDVGIAGESDATLNFGQKLNVAIDSEIGSRI
jgi:hypothetical protein